MCTGAEIGLILSAAGTATGAANQQRALRKQDRAAAQGLRSQGELQRQAANRATSELQDFSRSGPEGEQAASLDAYMNALRASQPSTEGSLPGVAMANPRYAEDVADSRQRVGADSAARAGRASVIDAAGMQRLREGQGIGRASAEIGELGRQSNAEDYLTRLRVAGIQPNPWVGAAGQIMQGVGGAMAMMPPGAAAPAATPMTTAAAAPQGMTRDFLENLRRQQNPFGGPRRLGP